MTDAQKSCPHVFIGKADGVHCTLCGLHLTAQQYRELLHPPESEKNAAPNKESAEDKKTAESAAKSTQEKPKRTRKKKVTTNG